MMQAQKLPVKRRTARSGWDISCDILAFCVEPRRTFEILVRCNLGWDSFREQLSYLMARDLAVGYMVDRRFVLQDTEKGKKAAEHYLALRSLFQ